MVVNTNMLNVFRRVIDDSRRISSSVPPSNTSIDCCLPTPSPLLPLLLDHKIPFSTARALSEAYDRAAVQLKRKTETLWSTSSNSTNSAQVYSASLDLYQQTLRQWAKKTLNTVLTRLNRAPVDVNDWEVIESTSKAPSKKILTPSNKGCRFDLGLEIPPSNVDKKQEHLPLPFAHQAPLHAFPAVYPPHIDLGAMTAHTRLFTSVPFWRQPSRSLSTSTNAELDIESLAEDFSVKLTITAIDDTHVNRLSPSPQGKNRYISPCAVLVSADVGTASPPTSMNTTCKSGGPLFSSRQKQETTRHVKSFRRKPPRLPMQSSHTSDDPSAVSSLRAGCNSSSVLIPYPNSPTTATPTPYTFSTKISGFSRQPVSPSLDTTSPTAISDGSSERPSNLTSTLASVIAHPLPRSGTSRKLAPFPRRMPRSLNKTTRSPSEETIDTSVSTLSRTPSLASISSCDSNILSSHDSPITPPPVHNELPFVYQNQDQLSAPDDSYLTVIPGTVAESNKSPNVHTSSAMGRMEGVYD